MGRRQNLQRSFCRILSYCSQHAFHSDTRFTFGWVTESRSYKILAKIKPYTWLMKSYFNTQLNVCNYEQFEVVDIDQCLYQIKHDPLSEYID